MVVGVSCQGFFHSISALINKAWDEKRMDVEVDLLLYQSVEATSHILLFL
jgi:hypothetical protein